jgi:hypothetical protein
MKRFLVFLLVVVGPMIGFGQTLRTTINAGILSQGNKGITATKLNNVLVTVADSVSSKANKSGGVFSGSITAPSFVRAGGTSLQFLKADGSVDASAFAILGNNNVFTGTNTFLTPVFANSVSTSAFSSITGAWSNTGNLGVFSLRYNTKSGGSTVTWNPVRLDANGFVGIGMDPTQAFEVAGAAKFNSAITATSLAASGAVSALSYSSTTGANFATSSGNVGIGTVSPNSIVHAIGTIQTSSTSSASTNYAGRFNNIIFSRFDLPTTFSNAISNSWSGTNTDQTMNFEVGNSSSTRVTVLSLLGNGNAGFGTNSPSAKLHISGSGDNTIKIASTATNNPYLNLTIQNTGSTPYGVFEAGDGITYRALALNPVSGNVLIGTSTITGYKLDVNGTAQATQFKLAALNTAPASATATGVVGEIRIDASYIYICTATNTWKRSALTTW